MRQRRPRLRIFVAAAMVIGGLTGCTGGSGGGSSDSAADYGYGPPPLTDGSVEYMPDVVLVRGGAKKVKAMSADGLVYTIDRSADGIDGVEVGKVMYLTSRVVGRVAAVEEVDDGIAVTLGPVGLTDIFEEAHFEIRTPVALDIDRAGMLSSPEVPGVSEPIGPSDPAKKTDGLPTENTTTTTTSTTQPTQPTTETGMRVVEMPPVSLVAHRAPAAPADDAGPKRGAEGLTKFTIGDFSAEPYLKTNAMGMKLGYKKNGLVLNLDFGIKGRPEAIAVVNVVGGKVVDALLEVNQIDSIDVGLTGGSETGQSSNIGVRVEVPLDLEIPLFESGVPAMLIVKQKFIVETAFSAKNSTLEGRAEYGVSGPIGFEYDGSKVVTKQPSINVVKSLLESLTGISVGVNAMVFTYQLKWLFGFGIPAAVGGPFASLTVAVTATAGSDLGIVKCFQASLTVVAGAGMGAQITDKAAAILARLGIKKIDVEIQPITVKVTERVGVLPKIKLCGA